MRLMREVRFQGLSGNVHEDAVVLNSWAGTTERDEIGRVWTLRAVVEGAVDSTTGYMCVLADIDDWLRRFIGPSLAMAFATDTISTRRLGQALQRAFGSAIASFPSPSSVLSLDVHVSPFVRIGVCKGDTDVVHLTQSFEFSASHRLYCSTMSEEENRRAFGKCANPNGHGHNYVLDVTIAGDPDERTGTLVDIPRFAQVVRERVIFTFDHKHLNLDCKDFASLNPSVENIARVIWTRLEAGFDPASLTSVRVWETPKTYAECMGD